MSDMIKVIRHPEESRVTKVRFGKKTQEIEYKEPCYRYDFSKNKVLLFSLQAVTIKEDIIYYVNDSKTVPTQFILVPNGKLFNEKSFPYNYCATVNGSLERLKSYIDHEFALQISSAEKIEDFGLEDSLVYAYIFTHTPAEKHRQIRLFDWENIDKEQHDFKKASLQPSVIKKTLNLTDDEKVYLPVIMKESGRMGLNHIKFTVLKSSSEEVEVEVFDTLALSSGRKKESDEAGLIFYDKIIVPKQDASGCGYLTSLITTKYITEGGLEEEVIPDIRGKTDMDEIKEYLIDEFQLTGIVPHIKIDSKKEMKKGKLHGISLMGSLSDIDASSNVGSNGVTTPKVIDPLLPKKDQSVPVFSKN